MAVAILTVGNEILAGDIQNTNTTWLAREVTDRGATVVRMLTVPDDPELIGRTVRKWSDAFDAVIVTGGLGGTHDDVTTEAIADAFDRDLLIDDDIREDVIRNVAAYQEANNEAVGTYGIEFDIDAWAALPEGSHTLPNPKGICPGYVLENVYAFPGVPMEMKAMFREVAPEFRGDAVSRTLYTPQPEKSMLDAMVGVREHFDVAVGSYPATQGPHRLKVTGTDERTVDEAIAWLRERVETLDVR